MIEQLEQLMSMIRADIDGAHGNPSVVVVVLDDLGSRPIGFGNASDFVNAAASILASVSNSHETGRCETCDYAVSCANEALSGGLERFVGAKAAVC